MSGRIGFSLPRQLDTWWPFGSDPDALATTFAEVAESALDILERQSTVVEHWCERPVGNFSRPMQWMAAYPTTLRACVEMRAGRLGSAESQLQTAIRSAIDAGPDWYRALLQFVGQLRAARGDPARTAELLQWLT